ncbi:hypothetical protein MNBD_GAMMA22-2184 [hydrothermal vent metagenome]|uniref:Uncharacterized protein n=1 Tax=hydrothermal vent metagenome TaxID=652676 RepID=A0A3B1A7N1_9ZZZZ
MQIQNTSTSSALIQYRSTGSQGDDTSNGINPTSASARDKQSDGHQQATQQSANLETAKKIQTIPNLHIQRVSASKPVANDALASSTHSAKRAVQTFQEIDLLNETELMHRVDMLA